MAYILGFLLALGIVGKVLLTYRYATTNIHNTRQWNLAIVVLGVYLGIIFPLTLWRFSDRVFTWATWIAIGVIIAVLSIISDRFLSVHSNRAFFANIGKKKRE